MILQTNGMTVSVDSDLYVAGITEDGSEYTAEVYYVTLTAPSGKRWVHQSSFEGAVKDTSPDGFEFFGDVRESAKRAAEYLASRVRKRGFIDTKCWSKGDPVYGSVYYQQTERVW